MLHMATAEGDLPVSLFFKKPIYLFLFVIAVGIATTFGGCAASVYWLETISYKSMWSENSHILNARLLEPFFLLGMGISTLCAVSVSIFVSMRTRQQDLVNYRRERDIQRKANAAEAASAAKSVLLARISQNSRSPITSIIGVCEMLWAGQVFPAQ